MNQEFNSNNPDFTMLPTNSLDQLLVDIFQTIVLTLPSPNPIPNSGYVTYNYTVDPSAIDGGSGATNSNIVNTQVNQASIDYQSNGGLTKAVDKAYTKVGDVLTYTIALKNTGNITATNIVLTDTIPSGTTFVSNSVKLNNVTQMGATPAPPTGITVGTIGAGATSTVVFQVTVNTIPTVNPIPNNATVNFRYIIDPSLTPVPNSGNSNQVTTQVNQATIDYTNGQGMVKSSAPAYVKVGDIINYTIGLKNTGNVTALNVVFTDTVPSGTTFVADSVTLDGITQTGVNPAPPAGVTVGTISPGGVSTVTFNVTVNTIPSPNPIPNNSTVNYQFVVDPSLAPVSQGGNSNQATTPVNQATIDYTNGGGMVKSAAPAYAKVGDIITYTIGLKNTGNATATSIVFTDTIPSGTAFVANSVTLNGITQPGASPVPPTGVPVGTIGPGRVTTVTFRVTVNTIPTINPIPNNSTVNYQFLVNPLSAPVGGSGNSNQVTTPINQAVIDYTNGGGMVKSVVPPYAKVGDIITYTIGLGNTGNITATSVVFTDTIPSGTTFVANSVTLNGATQIGASPIPPTGVTVGTIGPGSSSTVTFKVTVNTIPTPNPIPNNSTVRYQYLVNPLSPPVSSSGNSNQVTTQVNQAIIDYTNGGGMVKSVVPLYAKVGDTITYTVRLRNTGNMTATNVVFTDTIPSGTTFMANSVTLNGAVQMGATPAPPSGVTVGTIGPGSVSTVTFKVTVNTIPSPNPVPNNSTVNFLYTVNPASTPATGSGNSNQVTTQVNQAVIDYTNGGGLVKSVSPSFVKAGDTVTYTIGIKNTGNQTATNVVFTDTIPTGTTFVANSVTLNLVAQPGATPVPPTGLTVGTIGPGTTSTVTFKVIVNTTTSPSPIANDSTVRYQYLVNPLSPPSSSSGNSNQVIIQTNQAIIDYTNGGGMVKSSAPAFVKVGDIITYTVGLRNTGNATATSVVFTDTIPSGTTFVANSVTLDGITQVGVSPQPPVGVTVGTLAPGGASTVTFQVTVDTIPTINPIPNNSTVGYQYLVNPISPPVNGGGNSNQVTNQVNQATIDYANGKGLVKLGNPSYAAVGDTITYTIGIKNTGNMTATNIVLTDTIPTDTTFVTNSVTLNGVVQAGVSPQPPVGVSVGTIGPGRVSTVTFRVTVNTIPSPNPIANNATVNFLFLVNPASSPVASSGNSNVYNTTISQAYIRNGDGGLVKSINPAFAKIGDMVTYSILLKNTGNVTANNIVVVDTIPIGTTFIANSVRINGSTQAGVNPQTGISVGSLAPGVPTTVTFSVTVVTIPVPNPTDNIASVGYSFIVDPSLPPRTQGNTSNTVALQVNSSVISIFSKSVDKAYAGTNDILNYTVVVKNTGNTAADNVIFVDTIPNGTTFITNSVAIAGIPQPGANPQAGFSLGTIGPNATVVVTFSVVTNP